MLHSHPITTYNVFLFSVTTVIYGRGTAVTKLNKKVLYRYRVTLCCLHERVILIRSWATKRKKLFNPPASSNVDNIFVDLQRSPWPSKAYIGLWRILAGSLSASLSNDGQSALFLYSFSNTNNSVILTIMHGALCINVFLTPSILSHHCKIGSIKYPDKQAHISHFAQFCCALVRVGLTHML